MARGFRGMYLSPEASFLALEGIHNPTLAFYLLVTLPYHFGAAQVKDPCGEEALLEDPASSERWSVVKFRNMSPAYRTLDSNQYRHLVYKDSWCQ